MRRQAIDWKKKYLQKTHLIKEPLSKNVKNLKLNNKKTI